MNIRDWEIIRTLYRFNNITKTAQHIFISQPALTARIKQIELYFNITMIIRGRRGIQFTPEGQYLAKEANQILNMHDKIKENVSAMKSDVTGTLKIGASKYFAKYKLPKLLGLFKGLYPDVEYEILTGWSEEVYKYIIDQKVHIGFIRGNYPWRGKRSILFEETLCVANTEPFDWKDLPNMSRIEYDTDRKLNDMIDDWWNEKYDQSPFIGLQVDQVDTCKELIINGLGYGIVPNLIIDQYPQIYKKTLLNKNNKPIRRKTWMYYNEDTLNMNMVDKFVKFINHINSKDL